MPFDLSTARPVEPQRRGFDLSTAHPVQVPSEGEGDEIIFHEESGKAVSVPLGLNADEANYLIETQVNGKDSGRFVGFVDMGADFTEELARGLLGWSTSIPGQLAGLEVEAGERLIERRGEIGNVFLKPLDPPQAGETRLDAAARMGIARFPGPDDLLLNLLAKSSLPEKLLGAGKVLQDSNRQFVQDHGFVKREDDGIGYDAGPAFGSVFTAIVVNMMTGNVGYMAAFFGLLKKSGLYEEARSKGKTPDEAGALSTVGGVLEGALEGVYVGGKIFLVLAKKAKPVMRTLVRMAEEALQEMLQQGTEEILTRAKGLRDRSIEGLKEALQNIGYAGLIGFIAAGPGSTVSSVMEERAVQEGLSKEDAKAVAEVLSGRIEENQEELVGALADAVEGMASPLTQDPETQAQAAKIFQDFLAGKDIDFSIFTQEEQAQLEGVFAEDNPDIVQLTGEELGGI